MLMSGPRLERQSQQDLTSSLRAEASPEPQSRSQPAKLERREGGRLSMLLLARANLQNVNQFCFGFWV